MDVVRHLRRHCHHHHQRRLSFATVTALAFLLLASASAIRVSPTRKLGGGGEREKVKRESGSEELGRVMTQKRLGSSPPTCRSKCERCTPCKPVQVPIVPGLSIPLEYYPEAWRCKCSNRLFMP